MRWPTWDRAAPSPPAGLDTISRTNNFAVWSKNPSTCQTQACLWGPAWHLHWKAHSFFFSANPTSCKMQAEPSFREKDASKPLPHPETISCPSVWDQPGLSREPGAREREMRSPTGKAVLVKQSSADDGKLSGVTDWGDRLCSAALPLLQGGGWKSEQPLYLCLGEGT